MRPEFEPFPKMARHSRRAIVTEKIDGTNAQILITEEGEIFAGSRNRWITPEDDNYGFAGWVEANKTELMKLGPGSHFGEWWGLGIQRSYGLKEKRFSLFNSGRWSNPEARPACCAVVPVLWAGSFELLRTDELIEKLRSTGSVAAPGFMRPEGIVIYHTASKQMFKKTLDNDAVPKSLCQPF